MAKRLSWVVGHGAMAAPAAKLKADDMGKYLRSLGDYEVIMSCKLWRTGHRIYADVCDELAMLVILSPPGGVMPDVEDITGHPTLDHTQI